MRPLIAISGKKYSGKTTLANALAEEYGIPRRNFADAIKEGVKILGSEVDGPNKDVEALQVIGTDFYRHRDLDHWVKVFEKRYPDILETGAVIDDMRYPNEWEWCDEQGFILVRLMIDPGEQHLRALKMGAPPLQPAQQFHISEKALDHFRGWNWNIESPYEHTLEERLTLIRDVLEECGFDCAHLPGGEFSNLAVGATATSS